MGIFEELQQKGVKMNLVAYTTLIDAQARAGSMDKAEELFQQMELAGCEPNHITYSIVIKGYCFKADLPRAFELFQEMLGRGLKADAVVFNTLLDGCVRHSCFDLADELLASLEKYNISPSNFTLSIVVKMWGRRRQLDLAFEAVRCMPKKYPGSCRMDAQAGNCLLSICMQNGAPDRAVEAFREMETWPDFGFPEEQAYNVLISGLVKHRRRDQDLRLAAAFAEEACLRGCWSSGGRAAAAHQQRQSSYGVEPILQLLRALARDEHLDEELGRPLAAKLRSHGVDISNPVVAERRSLVSGGQRWAPGSRRP